MKEYSPKPDLWSKIQQRMDFDQQVQNHVPNLPERLPKVALWDAIERELDQRRPIVPIWRFAKVAASIALIVALSITAYLELRVTSSNPMPLSEEMFNPPTLNSIGEEHKVQTERTETLMDEKLVPEDIPETFQPKAIIKKRIDPIETAKLILPNLTIEEVLVSELIVPSIPLPEAPKTLHQVQISWVIQDKSKLRTTFGAGIPKDVINQQIGQANQSAGAIQIKFEKQ